MKNEIEIYGLIRVFFVSFISNYIKSKEASTKPKLTPKMTRKKKEVSDEEKVKPKFGRKCTLESSNDDKKLYVPRRIFAKRMKSKKTKKNIISMSIAPLVDCR